MCLYTHYNAILIKADKTVGYKDLDYDKCIYIFDLFPCTVNISLCIID